MKNKLLVLGVLAVGFIIFVLVKVFVLDKNAAQGSLKVNTSPTTAVIIDAKNVGKTPYDAGLSVGEHQLKLQPEEASAGIPAWEGKIIVNPGTKTFVDRELGSDENSSSGVIISLKKTNTITEKDAGEVYVETEPGGAIVYLDNDEKGLSTITLQNVKSGEHEISVYSPGFIRRSQRVNLPAGFRVSAQFKLAVDPSYKKVEEITPTATPSADLSPTVTPKITGKITPKITSKVTPTVTPRITSKPGAEVFVVIKDTPTGWLRVREEPSTSASESAKVNPGEKYALLDEKAGWQKIEYDPGKFGWVSAQYTEKK